MINDPIIVSGDQLKDVWIRSVQASLSPSNKHRSLVVTLKANSEGDIARCPEFEKGLNRCYVEIGERGTGIVPIEDNAYMVFPESVWIAAGHDREKFYDRYRRLESRLKKMSVKNRYGIYFSRMINYTSMKKGKANVINQLDFIIDQISRRSKVRESALQIAIFNPCEDSTGQAMRGFPCLQQIGVSYCDDRGISLNALYPNQYIFERAYGNYAGLCNLGRFLARESNHVFRGLQCTVGRMKKDSSTAKADIRSALSKLS